MNKKKNNNINDNEVEKNNVGYDNAKDQRGY